MNLSFEAKHGASFLHKATEDSLKIIMKVDEEITENSKNLRFNMVLYDMNNRHIDKVQDGQPNKIYLIKPKIFRELGNIVRYKIMLISM